MIIVDSSVWIDYFSGVNNPETDRLDNFLGVKPVAVGDIILTEVLQGFRHEKDYRAARELAEDVTVFEMLGVDMAVECRKLPRSAQERHHYSEDCRSHYCHVLYRAASAFTVH